MGLFENFMSTPSDDELTPEENEWMNAPMGDFPKHQSQYETELLAVMWRWAKESDLTMAEWLQSTHRAIERVILK